MRSCIFSIITPVFSVTWSSEIILICWFTAQQTMLKTVYIFVFFYFLDFSDEQSWKDQHLFQIFFFSLLSLFINLMHPCWIIILLIPNFWTVVYINMCFSFACSSVFLYISWRLIQFSRLLESLLFTNHQKSLWFTEFFQSSSCVLLCMHWICSKT